MRYLLDCLSGSRHLGACLQHGLLETLVSGLPNLRRADTREQEQPSHREICGSSGRGHWVPLLLALLDPTRSLVRLMIGLQPRRF